MLQSKRRLCQLIAVAMGVVIIGSGMSSAELPHENFDLVGTNIDMIISLLNASINITELSLVSCLQEKPDLAWDNLNIMDGILGPAEALIDEIKDIASSYFNLSYLIPPFSELSTEAGYFAENQSDFLVGISILMEYAARDSLSAEDFQDAQSWLVDCRQKIFRMDSCLDELDVITDSIADLSIDDKNPFDVSYLKELIDRLRGLLDTYLEQIDGLFVSTKWDSPFVSLILDDDTYYLGETVRGSGYAYNGSAPISGVDAQIIKDYQQFLSAPIGSNGVFGFSWLIPAVPGELGPHSFMASVPFEPDNLTSAQIPIEIIKIATELTVALNGDRFSPDEEFVFSAVLTDFRGSVLSGALINLSVDSFHQEEMSDSSGTAALVMQSGTFGFGEHYAIARFLGTEIYEECQSSTILFDINYLTQLRMGLSSNRVEKGDELTVNISLTVNESEPIPGMTIDVRLNGTRLSLIDTAGDGSATITMNTSDLPVGAHVLIAFFNSSKAMLSDAESDPMVFVVFVTSSSTGDDDNIIPWNPLDPEHPEYLLFLLLMIVLVIGLALEGNRRRGRRERGPRDEGSIFISKEVEELAQPASADDEIRGGYHIEMKESKEMDPRAAIVSLYNSLLAFLIAEREMNIASHLTPREIADLLRGIDYPADAVMGTTYLFERALYSKEEMRETDRMTFSNHVDMIREFRPGEET